MKHIPKIILIFLMLTGYAASADWPLKGTPDLSSGFGDFRPRRFHVGLDLRTGGKIGQTLYSPVDGYIWRIRTAYTGYGKVLYLKGTDGYIYVMAHLDSFNPRITELVEQTQLASQRYYIDLLLPADSLPVKKGEVLGQTGKTGIGAPHLHFEKRTSDNLPLNPLTHGLALTDETAPTISRLGLKQMDNRGLFDNGERTLFLKTTRTDDGYGIGDKLVLSRPFGVMIDGYDQHRPDGMRQAIYRLTLSVDGDPYYQIVLDTLDFGDGVQSDLEYDVAEAVDDRTRVRRLYAETGNTLAVSTALAGNRGAIGLVLPMTYGKHRAAVTAEDAFGNRSMLTFEFIWVPSEDLYRYDSTVTVSETMIHAYFTPSPALNDLDPKETFVEMDKPIIWKRHDSSSVETLPDGRLRVTVREPAIPKKPFRLVTVTRDGYRVIGSPFHGFKNFGSSKVTLHTRVVEDGFIVSAKVNTTSVGRPNLLLYYQDSLVGDYPVVQYYDATQYYFFVPPDPKLNRVDRLGLIWQGNEDKMPLVTEDVHLFLVGDEDNEQVTIDSSFRMTFDRSDFYSPRYVRLEVNPQVISFRGVTSDHYWIDPKAFISRNDFDLTLRMRGINQAYPKAGVCWLDSTKDEWVWLTDNLWHDSLYGLTATSAGGGSFAAVFDIEPPEITAVNHRPQGTYPSPKRNITFKVTDNLSGIEDDRSIEVRFDGEWMIPEFDPETGICKTQRLRNVGKGEHHIGIIVTDRAGNKGEQYVTFTIN
jgi:hypothetical protein